MSLVFSLCLYGQSKSEAQAAWDSALEQLAQCERALDHVYAVASIERSVQRSHEDLPTIITKATARIWTDDPKYRVEIENEISLESIGKGRPYTPTGIRRHTLTFDGATVCSVLDMDNGDRKGFDYGREYALPLMFAGFPSTHPVRPWTLSLQVDRLQAKEFDCDYLPSGMLHVQSRASRPRDRSRAIYYLTPKSYEIRRIEYRDSFKRLGSVDLTWSTYDEKVFLERFVRQGRAASSQFPGEEFHNKTTFEILHIQTDQEISQDWFTRESLGEAGTWIHVPTTY